MSMIQILRSDYILQQRRWEEERARSAPDFIPEFEEFEEDKDDFPTSGFSRGTVLYPSTPRLSAHKTEDDEVDAVAQMEEQELRELVALAEESEAQRMEMPMKEQSIPSSPTRYGSDEEEYEDIFMEIVSSQQGAQAAAQQQIQGHHAQEDVEMDMSNG
jgi:hypothetical protein